MSLQDAFQKLRDGLQDLGSLEVRSYSGDVNAIVSGMQGEDDFRAMIEQAVKDGNIKLKIYTRLDADGDSDHFLAEAGVEPELAESHVAAFQMGQEIRRGYIELFKELAEGIIK